MKTFGEVTTTGAARLVAVPELSSPAPRTEIISQPVAYEVLADGRTIARDHAGMLVGLFTNKALAEGTVDFLSR